MIEKIGASVVGTRYSNTRAQNAQVANNASMSVPSFSKNYTTTSLVNAYQAFYGIQTAKSISFGQGLAHTFESLKEVMYTCRDEQSGKAGEEVGKRTNVSEIITKHFMDLPQLEDAIKTNIIVNEEKVDTPIDKNEKETIKEMTIDDFINDFKL